MNEATNLTAISTKGDRVIAFGEQFCRHPQGPHAGELIKFAPFQKDILRGVFELDANGLWKHRTALIILPRKCGKSELLSVVGLWALVACGEIGAEIYAAAGSRDQARRVFDVAKQMVRWDTDLSNLCKVYRNKIEIAETGNTFEVLSADAGLQHGRNPVLSIVDETHVHPSGELTEALASGSGARVQSMVIHITTPGSDPNSYLADLVEYGRKVHAGDVIDPSWYQSWNPPPEGADHRDPAVWRAYNPGLANGWISETYLQSQCEQLHESEFRRLHLAQWTKSHQAWIPAGAWDQCFDPDLLIADGEAVCLGVDGSYSRDNGAVIAATRDGRIYPVWSWEQSEHTDRLPFPEMEQVIREACDRWKVREIAYDRYAVADTMARLEAEGYPCIEFPQSTTRLAPACGRFLDAVLDRTLTHSGTGLLKRHIENCRIKSDQYGTRIIKESKDSKNKIDSALAAVLAYDAACLFAEETPRAPLRLYSLDPEGNLTW
jgi:phage terminase large subunit-like protein